MNEEVKVEEEIEVQKPLDGAFNLFSELNTLLAERDKYSEQHLKIKSEELLSEVAKSTGIKFPGLSELEESISKKDEELTLLKSEGESMKGKLSEMEKQILELSAENQKFKAGRIGKIYGEKEITDIRMECKRDTFLSIKDARERADYYKQNQADILAGR